MFPHPKDVLPKYTNKGLQIGLVAYRPSVVQSPPVGSLCLLPSAASAFRTVPGQRALRPQAPTGLDTLPVSPKATSDLTGPFTAPFPLGARPPRNPTCVTFHSSVGTASLPPSAQNADLRSARRVPCRLHKPSAPIKVGPPQGRASFSFWAPCAGRPSVFQRLARGVPKVPVLLWEMGPLSQKGFSQWSVRWRTRQTP